jgi:hypothetical protein
VHFLQLTCKLLPDCNRSGPRSKDDSKCCSIDLYCHQWRIQEFFSGGSTNSVEDRRQRERGSGGDSPLVRGSAQFAIRFDFVKLSGCRGCVRMYCPRNWEFGSALPTRQNGGGGVEPPKPPLGTPPTATCTFYIGYLHCNISNQDKTGSNT